LCVKRHHVSQGTMKNMSHITHLAYVPLKRSISAEKKVHGYLLHFVENFLLQKNEDILGMQGVQPLQAMTTCRPSHHVGTNGR